MADEALTRLQRDEPRPARARTPAGPTGELDGKKALIDQQLGAMTDELGKVGELVRTLEADRRTAFGELANELRRQHEGLNALTEHTQQLREVLASSEGARPMGRAHGRRRAAARGLPRRRQLPQAGDARRIAAAVPTTRS